MTLGLVGCGRMGKALVIGALKAKAIGASDLIGYDVNASAVEALVEECGAKPAANLGELLAVADVILLCTKPQIVDTVLRGLAADPSTKCPLVISVAAGVKISAMEEPAGPKARIIRAMPNTPALVGHGAAAFALGATATREDAEIACKLLGSVGEVVEVKEQLLDAVTGLSGSGPAYVYLFIEALAEAGIRNGLDPDQALTLATQTTLGAAVMVRDTGLSPSALIDMVTSPGGTTLAGLEAMEQAGFRAACAAAVDAATQRSLEMGA
jgi:pyrroline-5-carboxylate reductase